MLRPGVGREVRVSLPSAPGARVDLAVPKGWTAARLGEAEFLLRSDGPVADRSELVVTVDGKAVKFTVLGPGEAKGFAAGDNVATCPRCQARIEACMCPK